MSYQLTIVLGDRHSCHCIPLKHLHTDIPESLNIIKSMHVPWQAMNSIKKRHQRSYACWSLGFNFSPIESRWPDRTSVLLTVGKMFLMRQNAGEKHPHGPMAPWHGIVCLAGQGCDSCAPAAVSVVSVVAHTKPFSEFGLCLTKSWPWKIEIVCMPSRHPGSQSATFNEY